MNWQPPASKPRAQPISFVHISFRWRLNRVSSSVPDPMPIGDDVFFSSVVDLNKRLLAKEFSAVELTRAFCDRLEQMGPRLNAVALSLREPAMRQAKDVDGDLGRERFRGP